MDNFDTPSNRSSPEPSAGLSAGRGDEQAVRGTVSTITFRNNDNGYMVFKMRLNDGSLLAVTGNGPLELGVGQQVFVRGVFTNHKKFGMQLTARAISTLLPTSTEGILNYLSGGSIKGIGPKTAESLVQAFGEKTLEVLAQDPAKAARIIGPNKAGILAESLRNMQAEGVVRQFLAEHNISSFLGDKIIKRFGLEAVEKITQDPFLLARDPGISGIGFKKADEIAKKLNFPADSPARVRAALHYTMHEAADEGHVFLTLDLLFKRAQVLLGELPEERLSEALKELEREVALQREDSRVYLPFLLAAERYVADVIRLWRDAPTVRPIPESQVAMAIAQTETSLGMTLSPEQQEAVRRCACSEIFLLTGGPGCGKTTTIQAISKLFLAAGKRLFMAAPTGKAAQRMSHVTGHGASTIHRLLKYDPFRGTFLHNAEQPLPADAIIVDESSMIDIQLAKDLVAAIPAGCHVIFVGDKDQLPSVGPGRFFAELLKVPGVPSLQLTRLFRRGESSRINDVAHQVNTGIIPNIPQPDGTTKSDAYFIQRNTPEEIAALVEKLVAEQLPKKFGFSRDEITVLTPANRGAIGTQALNELLQRRLNPATTPERELILKGGGVLRVGDRVTQRVNNYNIDEAGVFNGDSGVVVSVSPADYTVQVELWDGRLITYEPGMIHQLALSYATTVHRSQGSEIPCVVLALHESQFTLLERQLIYTGITRAKKLLVIVGSQKALEIATRRVSSSRRLSNLIERIG